MLGRFRVLNTIAINHYNTCHCSQVQSTDGQYRLIHTIHLNSTDGYIMFRTCRVSRVIATIFAIIASSFAVDPDHLGMVALRSGANFALPLLLRDPLWADH